ncbi:hypothetical protein Cgig2_026678 [Carnegiea gigantea]|uniref:Uncharacterized protein n=1 Tax=Carnegiea gigantea TaxID=171969 RepID=A0A9Q1JYF7_9CARY|nr:hypothetical protein Cgig2_026678 [Carnegiea gigantea]
MGIEGENKAQARGSFTGWSPNQVEALFKIFKERERKETISETHQITHKPQNVPGCNYEIQNLQRWQGDGATAVMEEAASPKATKERSALGERTWGDREGFPVHKLRWGRRRSSNGAWAVEAKFERLTGGGDPSEAEKTTELQEAFFRYRGDKDESEYKSMYNGLLTRRERERGGRGERRLGHLQ